MSVEKGMQSQRRVFSEAALAEARAIRLTPEFFADRPFAQGITIDGPFSRDLDDAFMIERTAQGYLIHVSIADVAAVIPLHSELDNEAHERAFTRYHRRDNEPMLPALLSEDLLSLLEGELRPTITATIPLDNQFLPGEPSFSFTKLASLRKMSHEEADEILADESMPLHQFLAEAALVAHKLLEHRRSRGALAFYDLEKGIGTDEDGLLHQLAPEEAHVSHIIIQELMILTNEAVAKFLAEKNVPTLFRNHTAKLHAPPRENVFADIEAALDQPVLFNLDLLRERVFLLMNRAQYSSYLEGHYGLNVPAYLHFTSPIRRQADVVNQRILTAALRGEESPYTQAQLEEMATYLNSQADEIKDQRRRIEKEKAVQKAKQLIDAGTISAADDSLLERIIKVAIREDAFTPEVQTEIERRLDEDRLTIIHILHLLFDLKKNNEQWQSLYERIFEWLQGKPHHAVSLAVMAKQILHWPDVSYETERSGADHAPGFTTVARITVADEEFVSPAVTESNRKLSQQVATVCLLAAVVGLQLPEDISASTDEAFLAPALLANADEANDDGEDDEDIDPGVNYRGLLQEFIQQQGWSLPEYTDEQAGPTHDPHFYVSVLVRTETEVYQSEKMKARKKKLAYQKAARDLLNQLLAEGFRPTMQKDQKSVPTVEVSGDDYVSALQIFIARAHWAMPRYTGSQEKSGNFVCDVAVKTPDGWKNVRGISPENAKKAKQSAARKMFEELSAENN